MNRYTDYAKVEAMLEPLVRQHGADTVLAHLETLFYGSKLSNYQTVQSLVRNISNRIGRQHEQGK